MLFQTVLPLNLLLLALLVPRHITISMDIELVRLGLNGGSRQGRRLEGLEYRKKWLLDVIYLSAILIRYGFSLFDSILFYFLNSILF